MSESIWWPDEAWYERKVLPLGFVTLSFRQLGTIALAFAAAFLISLHLNFPIDGVSFGGRAALFCTIFGGGYVVASRRVKLVPAELQALYVLRTRASEKLDAILRRSVNSEAEGIADAGKLVVQEITVEDLNPISLVLAGNVTAINQETVARLFLDMELRGEDLVSPTKPRFRLVYRPLPQDVGSHNLAVRLDGMLTSFLTVRLSVKGRSSTETREAITKVG